ncbi:flippase-like domain-containing protein [bacterium]|nr:flippase-like domain-containing protein [bacterium]
MSIVTTSTRKGLIWAIGVAVSIGTLIFLVRLVDFGRVAERIADARGWPLALAIVNSLVANLLFSGWQWRTVFAEMGDLLPISEHIFVKTAIYPLRAATPGRAGGEIGRAIYMQRVHNIPIARTVAATAVLFTVNLGIFLALSIIGFLTIGSFALAGLCALALFALVLATFMSRAYLRSKADLPRDTWWGRRLIDISPAAKITTSGFLPIVLLGTLTIVGEVVELALVAHAIGVPLTIRDALAFGPIILLAGTMPFTFMGIGLREAATVYLLSAYATAEKLFAVGLLYSFTDKLLLALMGLATLFPFILACGAEKKPKPQQ